MPMGSVLIVSRIFEFRSLSLVSAEVRSFNSEVGDLFSAEDDPFQL